MPPAEQLYAANLSLQSELVAAQTAKQALEGALSAANEQIATLKIQIDWLKKRLFGPGRGETLDRAQLLLQLEGLEKIADQLERSKQAIAYERTTPQPRSERKSTEELFANVPVKETLTIEPAEVKAEPTAYEKIGEEKTFEIDITPPKLFKRAIVRPKYRKVADKTQAPVTAPAPARVAPGGYASAGLIAFILVAKYVNHQPLYRLEKQSPHWGARLSRQTLMDWVGLGAFWLEIIFKQMHAQLLGSGYVQCDETPVRCQDPDTPGKTVQGWLWVLSRPGDDVVFEWRMSRRKEEATSLLSGYKGLLQSDAYGAYAALAKANPDITRVGCWAHARRYFHEALAENPRRASYMLRLIGHLYYLERIWDQAGHTGPKLRAALRQSGFALTLGLLKRTAKRLKELVLPKSLLGQACAYLLGHWDVLCAHNEHGQTRIDNNLIENAIRPSAIGKKNWLFIGHPEAGQRTAVIYSIVVSCQRRGIDPLEYLKDVLTRLPRMNNQDDLTALTPAKWKPTAIVG